MAPRKKASDKPLELSPDDKIVREAQDRFKRCQDWEANFQTLYKDDVKFANGDSDNGWQWPRDLKKEREKNKRPSLTINKTAQKVQLIVNEARQNKASVTIKPTGEETSFRAAQIYEGVVREIEYTSRAQAIYDEAMASTVEGGIGWWRVGTVYDSDNVSSHEKPDVSWFNQSIVILPIKNQLGVYLDPDHQQPDGSDSKFGFVFNDIPKSEAENSWPDVSFSASSSTLSGPDTWIKIDNIRVAEYYRIVEDDDELIFMEDEHGQASTFFKSDVPAKFRKQLDDAETSGQEFKRRKVKKRRLEWFKIVGDVIVDRRAGVADSLKGKYVPLVRMVGQERVIDGELYRRGHVRYLKDPQRMYNYNSSGQVEYGALQTKVPWVGPKSAFEGNEDMWNRANEQNYAYLPVNDWDTENDRAIAMPQRPQPPGTSPAFLDGMRIADHEMDMASGQFEATEGRTGNERSGKAIQERQRPGETANYHFIDHQAIAIRYTGMIILDLFPHVYDTERIIQIRGRDGVQSKVTIKPDMDQVLDEQKDAEVMKVMFNPKIGKYLVEADVGPAYGTQRQEAWNAFVQIVTGAPDLINEIGDLMFRSADFPLADKIAERLMRKIKAEKPYLFDDQAPTPQVQQMQKQIQDLTQQVGEAMQALAEKRLKLVGKEQLRDIEAYDANSKRLTAVAGAVKNLGERQDLDQQIRKTLADMFGMDLTSHVEQLGGESGPMDIPDMGLGGGLDANGALRSTGPNTSTPQDGVLHATHPVTGEPMIGIPPGGGQ